MKNEVRGPAGPRDNGSAAVAAVSASQTAARTLAPLDYGPRFALVDRRGPGWRTVLVAAVLAGGAATLLAWGLGHAHGRSLRAEVDRVMRGGSPAGNDADDKDDPNQVDVVYLGDAADAPEPTRRPGHYRAVHPTIAIRLPRFGKDAGLIPDNAAGRLLYQWLAAFNQANDGAMQALLPPNAADAEVQLRQQTGGFRLLSAAEVAPGVIVFRLQDQTPLATEALGTLAMRPGSNPPTIQSFSLQAVPPK